MKCKEYAEIFLALADENRVKIIQLLSNEEMCACELLNNLKITQSTLSHHMKKLVFGGIVKQRREGKNIFYKIDKETIQDLKGFVDNIGSKTLYCMECE